MPRFHALIPAAGSGSRMGHALPKQYLELQGRPLLWHTLQVFERHPEVTSIHVVIAPDDTVWTRHDWSACPKLHVHRCGGATRAQTVLAGLRAMTAADNDWVLVHDAARPCLTQTALNRLIATVRDDAVGGILAIPVADTLKRAGEGDRIAATVIRTGLWGAQTPQMFRRGLLIQALEQALEQAGDAVTDEASAIEVMGLAPLLVEGDPANLKVTHPADLPLAARYLELALEQGPTHAG